MTTAAVDEKTGEIVYGDQTASVMGYGGCMPGGFTEIGSPGQLAALYTALGIAQAMFAAVHRSKTVNVRTKDGGSYSFSYAPLEDLLAATRPALAETGLSVLTPAVRGSTCKVLVIVAHSGGGRICSEFAFEPRGDMKDLAGQVTYLRRYGYSSMLNLAADDDAEDAPDLPATKASQKASETRVQPHSAAPSHTTGASDPTTQSAPLNAVEQLNQMRPDDGYADGTPSGTSTAQRKVATPEQLATYNRGLDSATILHLDLERFRLAKDATREDAAAMIAKLSAECQEARSEQKTAAVVAS